MSDLKQKKSWWEIVAKWQDKRWLWLLCGAIALSFELIAVYYFQGYLKQKPCEMCVYIRFAMIVIVIFSLITAIYPKSIILKLIGYIGILWGSIRGLLWSINLQMITLEKLSSDYNPFAHSCSITETKFPFGLPLNHWFPSHFQQTGICGDSLWTLWGLNMAEYMIITFSLFLLFVGIALLCWFFSMMQCTKNQKGSH